MTDLVNGMLVQHTSLGIGKVVAIEATAVHVFFPESEKRFAAKLRMPVARPLLKTEGVEPNPWLLELSSFSFDEVSGRYALPASWLTRDQAIADFLAVFPGGFTDPAYLGAGSARRGRAARWRAAQAEWARSLGAGEGDRLLAAGDVRGLVERALRVAEHLTFASEQFGREGMREAFRDPAATLAFFEAVLGLLSVPVPGRARHEKVLAAGAGLGLDPGLAWPVSTVFPFVADPTRHVFLMPKAACAAAERLGFDLRLAPRPTWAPYAALRSFSARLLQSLEPSGARDFIDVEAFLHATATRRAPAAKRDGAGASKPADSRNTTRPHREGGAPRRKR